MLKNSNFFKPTLRSFVRMTKTRLSPRLTTISGLLGVLLSFNLLAAVPSQCQQNILELRTKGKLKSAAELASSCCDKEGDGFACNQLGFLIEMGSFRSQEKPEQLYLKACDAGYAGGCKNAAALYKGQGDIKQAKTLYHKACELKDGDACAEEILMDY